MPKIGENRRTREEKRATETTATMSCHIHPPRQSSQPKVNISLIAAQVHEIVALEKHPICQFLLLCSSGCTFFAFAFTIHV